MVDVKLNPLQETEEEKVQLAQKLLGLCTSVLKVRENMIKVHNHNLYIASKSSEIHIVLETP